MQSGLLKCKTNILMKGSRWWCAPFDGLLWLALCRVQVLEENAKLNQAHLQNLRNVYER